MWAALYSCSDPVDLIFNLLQVLAPHLGLEAQVAASRAYTSSPRCSHSLGSRSSFTSSLALLEEEFLHLLRAHGLDHMGMIRVQALLYHRVQVAHSIQVLLQDVEVLVHELYSLLAPALTDPALRTVLPKLTAVDVFASELPGESAFTWWSESTSPCWCFRAKHFIGYLVDSKVEQCHFCRRVPPLVLSRLLGHSQSHPLHFERVLGQPLVALATSSTTCRLLLLLLALRS